MEESASDHEMVAVLTLFTCEIDARQWSDLQVTSIEGPAGKDTDGENKENLHSSDPSAIVML